MLRLDRWDKLSLGALAISAAYTAAVYPSLPEKVPIHFDIHGVADGFAPRAAGAVLLPAIALFTWAIVRLGHRIMPPGTRDRMKASPMSAVGAVVVVPFALLHMLILRLAKSGGHELGASFSVLLAGMWIALGLLMPKLRRNPVAGIRTAWTLASDENWARTHRAGGIACTIAGFIALPFALGGSVAAPIVAILASALFALGYSFVAAHRERQA
ncbi:MAG: SdpI family protein [Byssovorax sp.]